MQARILIFLLPVLLANASAAQTATTAPDGATYEGEIVDGLRQGQGKITWPNGTRYEGGFDKGMPSGQGKAEMPSGEVYEGGFYRGLPSGKGKQTTRSSSYEGEFQKGSRWGQGKQTTKDGASYVGSFVQDEIDGPGRLELKSGDIYEGRFVAGELQQGKIMLKNGNVYEGEVKDWLADGKGRYTTPDKTEYSGVFSKGSLNGKGSMTRGKFKYEGEFLNFRMDGEGKFTYDNGDFYVGQFKNGLYHGKGTLTYAKPQRDGSTSKSGEWAYGKFQDPAAEQKREQDIETALYQQQQLLDGALGKLQSGSNPHGTLFFLGIAGDGSQEVFHREVDFVRQQFDRDFSTRQHSLNLVNSRNTLTSQPLATKTSIRASLQRIASLMDKEKDILFLYITSHGSQSHEISLDPPGMYVAGLTASDLSQLLKESGIRWKVVVISACYSGGFLQPLKDDGTLVITAARHDRTSFGCSDENEFTYFGESFFKKALPQSKSFQQAFDKASVQIRELELSDMKKDGKTDEKYFSLPQMQNPSGIETRLESWWPHRAATKP